MDLRSAVMAVLIAQLSHPSYQVRQASQQGLAGMLPASLPHLLSAERKSSDVEVRQRVRQVLDGYWATNAKRFAQQAPALVGYRDFPWIAATQSVSEFSQCHYLRLARNEIGLDVQPAWNDYRLATRRMIEDLYANRVDEAEIREILEQLLVEERQWCRCHGHRFDPPVLPLDSKPK